jgi:N6-L-threonylcarbamoyladenine synthase
MDAIAVTIGPGLSSCLLVGMKEAKALALQYKKPLIPINHLEAHLLMVRMIEKEVQFPFLNLLVSGGHCMLVIAKGIGNFYKLNKKRIIQFWDPHKTIVSVNALIKLQDC